MVIMLPEDHGFGKKVWNLNDLSNPRLRESETHRLSNTKACVLLFMPTDDPDR